MPLLRNDIQCIYLAILCLDPVSTMQWSYWGESEEMLGGLELLSLGKSKEQAHRDIINVCKCVKGGCTEQSSFQRCPVAGKQVVGTNWNTRGSA